MLVEIACKLTQEKSNSRSSKEKESIIDVDHLELSLDVPSEKTSSRPSKIMDISLDEIKKALDSDRKKDEEKDVQVIWYIV